MFFHVRWTMKITLTNKSDEIERIDLNFEINCANRSKFFCFLRLGFTGIQCEININECETNPCLNGGQCHDKINGFQCTCALGFAGQRCQTNIDDCKSQPCRNKGICHDSIASYTCECPPGYTGK